MDKISSNHIVLLVTDEWWKVKRLLRFIEATEIIHLNAFLPAPDSAIPAELFEGLEHPPLVTTEQHRHRALTRLFRQIRTRGEATLLVHIADRFDEDDLRRLYTVDLSFLIDFGLTHIGTQRSAWRSRCHLMLDKTILDTFTFDDNLDLFKE